MHTLNHTYIHVINLLLVDEAFLPREKGFAV